MDIIQKHISALPDGRRQAIQALHDEIIQLFPGIETRLYGKIIGYGSYHYKYASGREGNWFPIGLANGVQYMSLYIIGMDGDKYLAENNQDRLGKVSVGKSCIRFKKLEDLNLPVVRELAQKSVEQLTS
jgi:hypothetical protein